MNYLYTFRFGLATAALAALSSCGGNTPEVPVAEINKPITDTELKQSRTVDSLSIQKGICKDWKWDKATNSITFTESKDCGVSSSELQLSFAEDLVVERPKSANPEFVSDFAAMDESGAYKGAIYVNGAEFTGRIKGFDKTGKKQVLDLWLKEGYRQGLFTVWSNTGRAHDKDFTTEVPTKIDITTTRKPILYFYPTKTTDLVVNLDFKGDLTTTYPLYNPATGWKVTAQTDGTLHDEQGKEYYALYWEGKSDYKYDLSTGFVVKGEASADFLDEKLAQLGLNRREANEFINYWLPELEQNAYNLIHFAGNEYTEQAALNIQPKPETLIRVLMVYTPLAKPISIMPQTLKTPIRKGFTVVEWGGQEQNTVPQMVR